MKPEEVTGIKYSPGFADCWSIHIEYDDWDDELICCSDNPCHPQGVFSSERGGLFKHVNGQFKTWDDLPETLKEFVIDYIKVSRGG